MDLPKLVELLTSGTLWLANAEVLADDDPYEGLPGAIRFPHRMWRDISEVPDLLRQQILSVYGSHPDMPPENAFRVWTQMEEQSCIMEQFGRRYFYASCWHAAIHESIAMWKIYGGPGAGVAVITSESRLRTRSH